MLKISAVYLIGKAEIPIHYTTWGQVEQALLQMNSTRYFWYDDILAELNWCIKSVLLHDHYVQKEYGTEMATVYLLPTVSSWSSVAQLHMPEEQLSW
jgi:hypothetical protein